MKERREIYREFLEAAVDLYSEFGGDSRIIFSKIILLKKYEAKIDVTAPDNVTSAVHKFNAMCMDFHEVINEAEKKEVSEIDTDLIPKIWNQLGEVKLAMRKETFEDTSITKSLLSAYSKILPEIKLEISLGKPK